LPGISCSPQPTIPGYEFLGELGRGGMGVVYRARQLSLNRLVALKMLLASRAGPDELARFRREAEAVARLRHPNFVHVYDIGEQDGRPFFSQEFVDGGSLAGKLAGAPQPPRQAAELLETLARAMHRAHQGGIVHRDLKPANVLLMADGTPKITDFGLAKQLRTEPDTPDYPQTQTGAILGTPSYMAPEQALGLVSAVGPATDVYALGAILYEMLTGRPPFRADTTLETLHQVATHKPVPPSRLQPQVPSELEAVCLRCLEKESARRYASAEDLADDLRRFLAMSSGQAHTPRPKIQVWAWVRRRPVAAVCAAGALVAVLALGLGLWLSLPRGNPVDNPGPRPSPSPPSWDVLRVNTEAGVPDNEVFERVAFPTRRVGYVASRQAVYRTEDGGKTWKRLQEVQSDRVYLLHFQDAQTGWLGTDRLQQTTDGGRTWAVVPLPDETSTVRDVALWPKGWGLACGTTEAGELVLFRRQNPQGGWEKLSAEGQAGYWGGAGRPYRQWSPGRLAVLGPSEAMLTLFRGHEPGGVVLHTTDGGDSWKVSITAEEDLFHVQFAGADRGWLAGGHGSLWVWQATGRRWQPHAVPEKVTPSCLAVDPHGSALALAPLWKGRVMMTTGTTWEVVRVPLDYATPSAAVVDGGCAYVLGSDGHLARYLDPRVP
jgi:serine/threonine protein kinase/photosystem II stability/assembly factor-like uncharacterized protein